MSYLLRAVGSMPRICAFYGIVIATRSQFACNSSRCSCVSDHGQRPPGKRAREHLSGGDRNLRLTFADGLVGEIDVSERLRGTVGPMFKPLRDETYFSQVAVDRDLGTIVWSNGADLAPEVLHAEVLSLTS